MVIEPYVEITLDLLTPYSVSVLSKTFADINGNKTQIGDNNRLAYMNSPLGREAIINDLPDSYYNAILSVWGSVPLLEDPKNLNV